MHIQVNKMRFNSNGLTIFEFNKNSKEIRTKQKVAMHLIAPKTKLLLNYFE